MLRHAARAHIQAETQLFRRPDGTLAFYFTPAYIAFLAAECNLEVVDASYCTVRTTNRRTQSIIHRVFVHGEFRKPAEVREDVTLSHALDQSIVEQQKSCESNL
jgi:hypothetical protein